MNLTESLLNSIRHKIASVIVRRKSWEKIEYFDESWKIRIAEMARYVAPGESIVDLGCGKMWLKPLLKDNEYYPVDYKRRDASTTVANFNNHEFPSIETDVAFVSGTLEYVEDYEWFVCQVCSHSRRCVVSYCTMEQFPDLEVRQLKAWKNHLSQAKLVGLFLANGMRIEAESTAIPQNPFFVFARTDSFDNESETASQNVAMPANDFA